MPQHTLNSKAKGFGTLATSLGFAKLTVIFAKCGCARESGESAGQFHPLYSSTIGKRKKKRRNCPLFFYFFLLVSCDDKCSVRQKAAWDVLSKLGVTGALV